MRIPVSNRSISLIAAVLIIPSALFSQDKPSLTRDPAALSLAAQVIEAAGGRAQWDQLKTYSISGNLTRYAAGGEEQQTISIEVADPDSLKVSIVNSESTKSITAIGSGGGSSDTREPSSRPITISTAQSLRLLSLPIPRLIQALNDQDVAVTSADEKSADLTNHVLMLDFGKDTKPIELVIDRRSLEILALRSSFSPPENMNESYSYELHFSDYRDESGLKIAHSFTEIAIGQKTWTAQLTRFLPNASVSVTEVGQ